MYERAFDLAPVFDAPANVVTFDAVVLEIPLPQANPIVAASCEGQCADLLQIRKVRLGISGQVRAYLLTRRSVTAEQDDVADALHMSVRTLRRRLAEEGTSYRELASETGGLLAEKLLAAGFTVEDVAHRLGYAGAPSFTRSFKHWKGTMPGHYARRQLRSTSRSVRQRDSRTQ